METRPLGQDVLSRLNRVVGRRFRESVGALRDVGVSTSLSIDSENFDQARIVSGSTPMDWHHAR